ncbi:MAG: hypothetical protein BRD55_02240 [Bacteroidetes bacterium SW_9_63_38]|nr:MAG: hypothetical protein BRD55_02240 [Bacteroidetes bacterium SW_9_63_38]
MSANDHLVTVARYESRGDAELARVRLEEADIPCMIANADQSGLPMMFDASRSKVQVKVVADRADDARALLANDS